MAAYTGTGQGTAGNPYKIATFAQLCEMATVNDALTAYWELSTNIDASASTILNGGEGWMPIGHNWMEPFSGQFDGKYCTISNLYINTIDLQYIGFFGCVSGTVKNLCLTNITYINGGLQPTIGAICGDLFGGIISHCYSSGSITVNVPFGSSSLTAGGLVGWAEGTISNCYSLISIGGTATGTKYIGGLVGDANPDDPGLFTTITNCYSAGAITGTGTYIGGFCGRLGTAIITSCYYDSQTSGQSDSGKGTAKTTSDMKKEATFTDWNFDTIWSITENISYPTFEPVTVSTTVNISYKQALVAVSNGEVWYESEPGVMVKLAASSGELQPGMTISAVAAYGKVFIADGVVKKVVDFVNTKLTVASMAVLPDRGTIIGQLISGAQMTVDYCTTTEIYGATIVGIFDTTNLIVDTAGEMTSSIPSSVTEPTIPHWYDWKVYPKGSTGKLPDYVNIMCLYRGRIMMNDLQNPYQWQMTRQDNPFDCLYMENDEQSPVSGQDGVLGLIGGIPTAFISYSDDYVVIGCIGSIDILRGDPTKGGELGPLYTTDGIFGPTSYCFDGMGNIYFMGLVGLYRMPAGGGIPEPLSNTRIPELMVGVDRDTHRITLGYNKEKSGIQISILNLTDNTSVDWWYDLRTEGMFPDKYAVGISAMLFYDATASEYIKLVAGCSDGYLRWWNPLAKSDQSADDGDIIIDSYITYGPLVISDGDMEAVVNNLFVSLGTDTDNVDWDIYVNDSAEELIDNLDNEGLFTGSFTEGGRQLNIRERARGAVIAIKFSNDEANKTFAIEQVGIDILPGGPLRK